MAPGPGAVDGDGRVAHARPPGRGGSTTRRRAARRRASPSVAAQLGVSDRHLRRIFEAEHGVTPLQYLQTRRLLLAKQLLTDTRLPVAQVALASGFRSLRRFNAAFAGGYRMSPTRLRGEADGARRPRRAGERRAPITRDARLPRRRTTRPRCSRFLAQRAIPGSSASRPRDPPHAARRRRARRASAGWLEAAFVPERRACRLCASPRRSRRQRRRRSPRCAAGSTSTPRPRRSTPRLAEPARRAGPAPAGQRRRVRAGGARRARPAGHGRRRRARSRAAWSSASARRSRRRGPSRPRLFPAPAALAGGAGRAHRRARHHPHARRRHPGARAGLADGSAPLLARRRATRGARRAPAARCPASAPGRRTTSRCARSAGPTPSRPATSPC